MQKFHLNSTNFPTKKAKLNAETCFVPANGSIIHRFSFSHFLCCAVLGIVAVSLFGKKTAQITVKKRVASFMMSL
jgi:hypothetical protein